jgi:hypothetical protein
MAQLHESPTEASDYAAINAVWAGLLGGVLLSSREAEAPSGAELPVLSLATFALSKAIAKEKVGSWVREPVVDHSTPDLKPKGRGLRYAVGELLTCSRCLGTWGSLGLVGLRVLRPRERARDRRHQRLAAGRLQLHHLPRERRAGGRAGAGAVRQSAWRMTGRFAAPASSRRRTGVV